MLKTKIIGSYPEPYSSISDAQCLMIVIIWKNNMVNMTQRDKRK